MSAAEVGEVGMDDDPAVGVEAVLALAVIVIALSRCLACFESGRPPARPGFWLFF